MRQVTLKGSDITALLTDVRVEHDLAAAGKTATLQVVHAPNDRFLYKINPSCGDAVTITWDDVPLFSGTIERVQFSSDALTLRLVCFEDSCRLAQNEIFRTFFDRPATVAAAVIEAVGLRPGSLWDKSGEVLLAASTGQSALSLLRRAYGGDCVVSMCDGAVCVTRPGAQSFVLNQEVLLAAEAEQSVEEMVNRAAVIGYQDSVQGSAQASGDIAAYGLRQRIYTLSGAKSTAQATAQDALQSLHTQASITLPGAPEVLCGARVAVQQPLWGIEGSYTVAHVRHHMADGLFTTTMGMVK